MEMSTPSEKYTELPIAGIAVVWAGIWLLMAVGCIVEASSNSSGMFSGLGYALAGLIALVGNAVSLPLHALQWRLHGAPGWLKVLIACQTLVVLGCVIWLLNWFWKDHLSDQRMARHWALVDAIRVDDASAVEAAWARCKDECDGGQLLNAADHGAIRSATFFLARGAKVSSALGEPKRDMETCEGTTLHALNPLAVAVARNDSAMVRLLFPASDAGARREALWIAARLDRLELVQALVQLGVPLDIRGRVLDDNETLLVAAAEGAALRVAQWLIATHHFPVNAQPDGPVRVRGPAPMAKVIEFASDAREVPRVLPFMRLLVASGARLDDLQHDGETWLQQAVRRKQKELVKNLLAVGANVSRLGESERQSMAQLLERPDRERYVPPPQRGCVPPGAQN